MPASMPLAFMMPVTITELKADDIDTGPPSKKSVTVAAGCVMTLPLTTTPPTEFRSIDPPVVVRLPVVKGTGGAVPPEVVTEGRRATAPFGVPLSPKENVPDGWLKVNSVILPDCLETLVAVTSPIISPPGAMTLTMPALPCCALTSTLPIIAPPDPFEAMFTVPPLPLPTPFAIMVGLPNTPQTLVTGGTPFELELNKLNDPSTATVPSVNCVPNPLYVTVVFPALMVLVVTPARSVTSPALPGPRPGMVLMTELGAKLIFLRDSAVKSAPNVTCWFRFKLSLEKSNGSPVTFMEATSSPPTFTNVLTVPASIVTGPLI
jgi:hypothetical protein